MSTDTLTEQNKQAIEWVAESILQYPERYDQSRWGKLMNDLAYLSSDDYDIEDPPLADSYFECGTMQCLAGWALLWEIKDYDPGTAIHEMFPTALDPLDELAGYGIEGPEKLAAEILGLNEKQRPIAFIHLDINLPAHYAARILRKAIDVGWDKALLWACEIKGWVPDCDGTTHV